MSSDELNLPELGSGSPSAPSSQDAVPASSSGVDGQGRFSAGLEPVFDVPVAVQAVIGRTRMEVADLMELREGSVLELDRRVGDAIDIYVNSRLVARGEIVIIDEQLGVTMTEIIKG